MINSISRKIVNIKKGFLLLILCGYFFSVTSYIYASPETLQYSYDNAREVTKIAYDDGTDIDYIYDNMGNRIFKTTTLAGAPANNVPNAAAEPITPLNYAIDVSVTPALTWTAGSDPDSDPVVYYIYLGDTIVPPLVTSGIPTSYAPVQLKSFTTYYWKIISRDNHNSETESQLWSFKTGNAPPVASFTADSQMLKVSLSVQFRDTSTDSDDGDSIVSWEWDFDTTLPSIDSTLQNPSYLYDSSGFYTVSLKVTDKYGVADTITKSNYISVYDDTDFDGVHDGIDNCLYAYNPDQANTDHLLTFDLFGDACDSDMDEDGYENEVDVCPLNYDPGQEDSDNDGYGDACHTSVCVSDNAEFQTALDSAEANNLNDVIHLVQGTYAPSVTFNYRSNYSNSLVIQGGYTDACASRVIDSKNTILDGGGTKQILKLEDISDEYNMRWLIVEGVTIQNGTQGVEINSQKGNIAINDNIIKGNISSGSGVAINATSSSGEIIVDSNTIKNNSGNSSTVNAYTTYKKTIITNNIIRGNTASNSHAGLYLNNGLSSALLNNDIIVSGNVIENNNANYYGGLYVSTMGADVTLVNNIIANNIADNYDAGIYVFLAAAGSKTTIVNNTITKNYVSKTSGNSAGLHLKLNHASTTADIYNNIIWGNSAWTGGDLYIENSVEGIINVYNNDYNPKEVYPRSPNFTNTGNNINADPQFIDASNGNYHLMFNSACIEAGNIGAPSLPTEDYESDARVLAAVPDIGADEYYRSGTTYAISGQITLDSSGIGGVEISLSGDAASTKMTDETGNYSFPWIEDGSYTVTPINAFYDYDQINIPITVIGSDITGVDFIATALDMDLDTVYDYEDNCLDEPNTNQADADNDGYGDVCDLANGSISGTVIDSISLSGIEGIYVRTYNGAYISDYTDINGYYEFHGLTNGIYTVYTYNTSGYTDEYYDDIKYNNPNYATRIKVYPDQETAEIDIALSALPVAGTGGSYAGLEGESITLDGSTSTPGEGIVLYEWDIDNNGSFDYSSSLPTQNHMYPQDGSYTIKLRVTDNQDNADEKITTADITDTSPIADFTSTPTAGMAPLLVYFINDSSGYDHPLSYEWDFDNSGNVDATDDNPSYTYSDMGIYSVELTTTDSDESNNSLLKINYITVCSPYNIRIAGATPGYFNTLQEAYDSAIEGDTIQIQAGTFVENLNTNRNVLVMLDGGYDCTFSSVVGVTTVEGQVNISSGTVKLSNIRISQ